MSKKTKKPKNDSSTIIATATSEEEKEQVRAKIILNPVIQSAVTIHRYNHGDYEVNINSLIEELSTQNEQVHNGSLKRTETLLLSQAHTLDALFGHYVGKAKGCEYLEHLKTYMNIGLRAQSQCRATLEALAEVKNPRPYIQNNRAEYQQVNNGERPQTSNAFKEQNTPIRAGEEKPKMTNGLLEDHTDEWMDTGTPEAASGNHKKLETLEAQHRAKDE